MFLLSSTNTGQYIGQLCVTRSFNVLSASGVRVYALVFVLEADIFNTRCNKDDVI